MAAVWSRSLRDPHSRAQLYLLCTLCIFVSQSMQILSEARALQMKMYLISCPSRRVCVYLSVAHFPHTRQAMAFCRFFLLPHPSTSLFPGTRSFRHTRPCSCSAPAPALRLPLARLPATRASVRAYLCVFCELVLQLRFKINYINGEPRVGGCCGRHSLLGGRGEGLLETTLWRR